jgi:lipoprotein-anchoring transpeptidase ErfK/SrfK
MTHPAARLPGGCRGVGACAVALLAATICGALAVPARAAGSERPASQSLVVLLHDHVARARPSVHARRIEAVPALRPLTRVRTVLPVLSRASDRPWVRVRLPGRPNGHAAWIRTWQTRRAATAWRIALDLSARRVTVYRGSRVARRFRAVIGAPWTPTPRGRFFVEEALALSPFAAGGPFALATSARSRVLQEFEGGPGQIALHGMNGLAGEPGAAASHGCIRLRARAITWMARRIGAGVPLTIRR